VHVVHGDDEPKAAFCDLLNNEIGLRADIPMPGQLTEI
jgi:hypothetical protein